jgi:hypothetical protein
MRGRHIPYSDEELAFIEARQADPRRVIHAAFVKAFARADVKVDDIKALCTRRGWSTGREPWLPEHDAELRELYADTPTEEIARRLGRELQATYRRAQLLGLAKSAAYLASPASGRLQAGSGAGAAHRFTKGRVPANKGMRRPGWTAGRMSDTQFRKGERTGTARHNWKPIGSERLVEGYRYTKVTDIPGAPHTVNWKATHVLRWEEKHGPIPEGMALKCLDGDRLNVDPANWEAIPRGMLPRLNGIHGHGYDAAPAELKPTIMAVAKLEQALHARSRAARRVSA